MFLAHLYETKFGRKVWSVITKNNSRFLLKILAVFNSSKVGQNFQNKVILQGSILPELAAYHFNGFNWKQSMFRNA